jgi:hypothetical protein
MRNLVKPPSFMAITLNLMEAVSPCRPCLSWASMEHCHPYLLQNVHKEKPFAGTAGEGCGFPAFINEPSVPQQSCAM